MKNLSILLIIAVSMVASMPNEDPHHKLRSYEELFGSKKDLSLDKSPELMKHEPIKKEDDERKKRSPTLAGKRIGKPNKKGVIIVSRKPLG